MYALRPLPASLYSIRGLFLAEPPPSSTLLEYAQCRNIRSFRLTETFPTLPVFPIPSALIIIELAKVGQNRRIALLLGAQRTLSLLGPLGIHSLPYLDACTLVAKTASRLTARIYGREGKEGGRGKFIFCTAIKRTTEVGAVNAHFCPWSKVLQGESVERTRISPPARTLC